MLPDYLDVTPGNGAPLYYRAMIAWSGVWSMPGGAESRKEFYEKYEQWREAPVDKLPLDDMRDTLAP